MVNTTHDPSAQRFQTINPATGDVLRAVQSADERIVSKAVLSAQEAYQVWSVMAGADRGRILRNAASILRARKSELARLEVLDTGKPIQEALTVDIDSAADAIDYFAGVAPTLHGHHVDLGGSFGYTRREPLGVCAGIGAWNYPLQIAAWKSAPALACGNTMVFKPAELTPLSTSVLGEIFIEAGVPPGVFNVVHGDETTGEMMTRHPDIAKVSLTGEVQTGKKVMEAAASSLKRVTLELGGKSPLVIFEDADLPNAASAALLANFYTQGEVCSNGTRVYVHESIHDEFVEMVAERTRKARIGDPLDVDTHIGALISEDHMNKVLKYVELGIREGATLVTGGNRAMTAECSRGFFVEPTVFSSCTDDMTIVKEEIFGPVMSVLSFSDESDVVRRANETHFGLSAGVFTMDLARAHRVASQIEAGTVWINTYNQTPIELPFGGNKQSGIGRENSLAAIEQYTQLKSVYVEMSHVASPF